MAFNNAEPMLKRLKTATLIRHFRHVKKRAKAKKALTRLRTIANKLIRELPTLILKIRLKPLTPIRFLKCTNSVALQGIPGI
jgi:hypothetical protein